ncbi:MAG: tyrosine-type recombinase/integrase [Alphaproteobacteria bacterium]|nr:tyrosine-type recombinase/integrase [Alphaproteobacteria bacterium]
MTWSLYDAHGQRKYLTARERAAFVRIAVRTGGPVGTFCAVLALTGARISEALALTPERIDRANDAIVFETLKRRERGIFRAVPVPRELVEFLYEVHDLEAVSHDTDQPFMRMWPWSRTTAWKHVKAVMRLANIPEAQAKPKALRHAFGVEAVQDRIAITLVKKWLGHAKLQSTEIYATPLGREERRLAAHMWRGIRGSFGPGSDQTESVSP